IVERPPTGCRRNRDLADREVGGIGDGRSGRRRFGDGAYRFAGREIAGLNEHARSLAGNSAHRQTPFGRLRASSSSPPASFFRKASSASSVLAWKVGTTHGRALTAPRLALRTVWLRRVCVPLSRNHQ